jgi:hypothetical protein
MGKRKYNAMLTCAPDQLGSGLPKADQAQAKIEAFRARTGRGIPVQLPAYYLPLQKRMDILTGVKR